jgi:hypothetical protein
VDVSSPTEANTPSGIDSAAGRISVTGVTIIPILAARHRQKTPTIDAVTHRQQTQRYHRRTVALRSQGTATVPARVAE